MGTTKAARWRSMTDAWRGWGRRNGRDREDLIAEIGGRIKSSISMLQSNLAMAEISKIASSLLPFGHEEANKGEPVVGATKEVLVFMRHISTRPETRSISLSSSASVMQMVRFAALVECLYQVNADGHQRTCGLILNEKISTQTCSPGVHTSNPAYSFCGKRC
jgi:hypothetical protein